VLQIDEVIKLKYPCLVPKRLCRTPVIVEIEQEGLNKYGEPNKSVVIKEMCNYQDSGQTILTAEKKLIQLSGTVLFTGDIAPEIPNITGGTVTVNGSLRRIFKGQKARNPDGSVNYTRLDLI
jgi:hypothetical protein